MDSTSEGLKSFRPFIDCAPQAPVSPDVLLIGTPSITYNGSLPAVIEPIPRMLTRFLLPGTPDADVIFTPDTRPCNNSSTPSTWRTLTSPGL